MSSEKNDECFLVFSDDWGEHPSSCQHLFRHIAKRYKTIWVNTIGMRNPTFTKRDLNKAFLKIRKMVTEPDSDEPKSRKENLRLSVCQPPMFPFSKMPFVRKINQILVKMVVRRQMEKMGIARPILMTTVPNAIDYIGYFDEKRVVYYCVDDFSEWPGLEKDLVIEMEKGLIQKSDLFMATSEQLYNKLAGKCKPTYLLTHGVDVEHFSRRRDAEHPLLQEIPKPMVGFFGLFDERSDQSLIAQLASEMPCISFVVTGKVEVNTERIKNCRNVYFTGDISYEELPKLVQGWDACFLPYANTKLVDSISPLKLKEYLATGKPVVSTPIKEALKLDGYIEIAYTKQDWIEILKSVVDQDGKDLTDLHEIRGAFLEKENWQNKAFELLNMCFNKGI